MDTLRFIENLVGRKADVSATWAEVTRARRLLGWEPRVSFEQGFEKLVRWYEENRTWAREIVTNG
jgi:UDP-glucuronate 4-epimerase